MKGKGFILGRERRLRGGACGKDETQVTLTAVRSVRVTSLLPMISQRRASI